MPKDWGLEWRLVPARGRESCRWQSAENAWVSLTLGHQRDVTKVVVSASDGRVEIVDGYEEGLNLARRWRAGWGSRRRSSQSAPNNTNDARPEGVTESRPDIPSQGTTPWPPPPRLQRTQPGSHPSNPGIPPLTPLPTTTPATQQSGRSLQLPPLVPERVKTGPLPIVKTPEEGPGPTQTNQTNQSNQSGKAGATGEDRSPISTPGLSPAEKRTEVTSRRRRPFPETK